MKTAILALGLFLCMQTGFSQTTPNVIFYRTGCAYGLLAHFKVNVDGKQLFVLKNKSIESTTLQPGSHTIAPRQARRGITLDVKSGQTYVIKYRTMIGIFGARPRLRIMTLDAAKADSKFFRSHYKM